MIDVIQLPSIHVFELVAKNISIDTRHTSGIGDKYVCTHCNIEGYDVGFFGQYVRVMDTERKINFCSYSIRGAKAPTAIKLRFVYPQMVVLNFVIGNTYKVLKRVGREKSTFFHVWIRHCDEVYYVPRECFVRIKRCDVSDEATAANIAAVIAGRKKAHTENKKALQRELHKLEFKRGMLK